MENIGDVAEYIARETANTEVGERFASRLERQCEKLARLPGTLGRLRPELADGIRSFPIGSYIIFFRYLGDVLEIVNVLEGHRDIAGFFAQAQGRRRGIPETEK